MKDDSSRDFNSYVDDYRNLSFEPTLEAYRRRLVLSLVSRYAPSASKVLEIGVGRRSLVADLADFDSAMIVEPVDQFLDLARTDLDARLNVNFFHGLLEDFSHSADGIQFDLVIMSSVLHEIPDSDEALSQVSTLLEVGGRMVVVVPNRYSIHRLVGRELGLIDSLTSKTETERRMQQNAAFSESDLSAALRRNGLEPLGSGTFFLKPWSHSKMAQMQEAGTISETELEWLYNVSDDVGGFGAEVYSVAEKL